MRLRQSVYKTWVSDHAGTASYMHAREPLADIQCWQTRGWQWQDWTVSYKTGSCRTVMDCAVQDWVVPYKNGSCRTRLGRSVQEWAVPYKTGSCRTRMGRAVQEWAVSYKTGSCRTRMGRAVQEWAVPYKNGLCRTRLGRALLGCPPWLRVVTQTFKHESPQLSERFPSIIACQSVYLWQYNSKSHFKLCLSFLLKRTWYKGFVTRYW